MDQDRAAYIRELGELGLQMAMSTDEHRAWGELLKRLLSEVRACRGQFENGISAELESWLGEFDGLIWLQLEQHDSWQPMH